MTKATTREVIIKTADTLFYQRGYEHTSFSDIAHLVGISRGNFYYHFKTKDEILDAVIQLRLDNTQEMLDRWEIEGKTPRDRIISFIKLLINNQSNIEQYGCPVGTLSTELSKLNHQSKDEANQLFTLFSIWLSRQFSLLGYPEESDKLALHLLARSQGIATLANAFSDTAFIEYEVNLLYDWLTIYTEKE